jgi:hypothetical protein
VLERQRQERVLTLTQRELEKATEKLLLDAESEAVEEVRRVVEVKAHGIAAKVVEIDVLGYHLD